LAGFSAFGVAGPILTTGGRIHCLTPFATDAEAPIPSKELAERPMRNVQH
jgi:hypothetical protein